MALAGYPALQYLQFGRVRKILGTARFLLTLTSGFTLTWGVPRASLIEAQDDLPSSSDERPLRLTLEALHFKIRESDGKRYVHAGPRGPHRGTRGGSPGLRRGT